MLTSRTRCPASARLSAVAQASEVLPTPPLPVKKTNFGRFSNISAPMPGTSASSPRTQQHFLAFGFGRLAFADPPQQDDAAAFGSADAEHPVGETKNVLCRRRFDRFADFDRFTHRFAGHIELARLVVMEFEAGFAACADRGAERDQFPDLPPSFQRLHGSVSRPAHAASSARSG